MDENKYTLALEVVTEWVEELMGQGYDRKEALQALLVLMEMRMIGAEDEEVGTYKTELNAIIRSQLGETND
jgi:hypothetical protein